MGIAAWQPYMRPYRAMECVLLWMKDVHSLCEPPPGDSQVRGQLLVMTPSEDLELPSRMAVFLRAGDYVLEMPQVWLKRTCVLCHLPRDRAEFKAIPVWVEFYSGHGYRPRWHRTEGPLAELVRARLTSGDPWPAQKLERMSLARLRKILGEDLLGTDGAVGFDAEGIIRRH
jgi:hypothetical protein